MHISTVPCALLLLGLSTTLHAQTADAGTRAGAWGAELSFNASTAALGAGILRFRNEQSAWVLGFSGSVTRQNSDRDDDFGFPSSDATLVDVSARLGVRSLRSPGSAIRPVVGGGLLGSTSHLTGRRRFWDVGAYGEFGVSRFFGPSFSLGAMSDIHVRWSEDRFGSETMSGIRVGIDAVRVAATVVF